jgi:hypothetical protein
MTYGVCELFYAADEMDHALAETHNTAGSPLEPHGFMKNFLPREMQERLLDSLGTTTTWIGDQDVYDWYDSFKITLLRAPSHGRLLNAKNDAAKYDVPSEYYLPDVNYVGKDRGDLLVEGHDDKGQPIALTLRYYINVLPEEKLHKIVKEGQAWKTRTKLCGAGKERNWRISENLLEEPATLADGYHTTSLQALLMGAKDALTGFTDLPGAALAQTTGDKITLDTDAAGHSWFFDYTPYLNEEWLPTSNPYEWKAKPGSEAEGKMDNSRCIRHRKEQPMRIPATDHGLQSAQSARSVL